MRHMTSNCDSLDTNPKILMSIPVLSPGDYVALVDRIPTTVGLYKTAIKIMAVIDRTKGKKKLPQRNIIG